MGRYELRSQLRRQPPINSLPRRYRAFRLRSLRSLRPRGISSLAWQRVTTPPNSLRRTTERAFAPCAPSLSPLHSRWRSRSALTRAPLSPRARGRRVRAMRFFESCSSNQNGAKTLLPLRSCLHAGGPCPVCGTVEHSRRRWWRIRAGFGGMREHCSTVRRSSRFSARDNCASCARRGPPPVNTTCALTSRRGRLAMCPIHATPQRRRRTNGPRVRYGRHSRS